MALGHLEKKCPSSELEGSDVPQIEWNQLATRQVIGNSRSACHWGSMSDEIRFEDGIESSSNCFRIKDISLFIYYDIRHLCLIWLNFKSFIHTMMNEWMDGWKMSNEPVFERITGCAWFYGLLSISEQRNSDRRDDQWRRTLDLCWHL